MSFWKQKLLDMGGFSVARNEDGELSLRMLQESPTAIYVSSKIKVWYYPRATWKRLWRQYIKYGRGRCLTHIRHPDKFHLRSRIPVFFIPGVLTFLLLLLRQQNRSILKRAQCQGALPLPSSLLDQTVGYYLEPE